MLTLSLGVLAHPVLSADDLIASELVSQAREWQQKNRDDLAAEIWRKLLRANPLHSEALIKLGVIEARAGNRTEAEALYKRADQLEKPPVGLKQLSAALNADQSTVPNLQSLPSQPKPKLSTLSVPLEPKVGKQTHYKQMAPVAITRIDKLVAPKTDALPSVVSKKKAPTAETSAPPTTDSKKKPVQATAVDALNLTFSDSLGITR